MKRVIARMLAAALTAFFIGTALCFVFLDQLSVGDPTIENGRVILPSRWDYLKMSFHVGTVLGVIAAVLAFAKAYGRHLGRKGESKA